MSLKDDLEPIAKALCKEFGSSTSEPWKDTFFWLEIQDFKGDILGKYPDKGLKQANTVVWAAPSLDQTTPSSPVSYSETTINRYDTDETSHFTYTTKTRRVFSWSLTETITTSLESSVEVGVPGVEKTGLKWTVGLSLSSTQGGTKDDEQDWAFTQDFKVLAHSAAKVTATISINSYKVPFTVHATLTGYVAIMTKASFQGKTPEGSIEVYYNTQYPIVLLVPIGSFIRYGKEHGMTTDFAYVDPNTAVRELAGVCTGSQGVDKQTLIEPVSLQGIPEGAVVRDIVR